MERSKVIIRTSIVGIAVNLVLVLFKMAVGLITNSIAVILDAINNLSDALSSIITIVGTMLAGRAPDKKHPYGYGRIEYLTSMLISILVLLAGATSLKESAVKVIHPQSAAYTAASLVIIAAAVVAKFFCGRYVKGIGEKINSDSLIASGSDAFFDAVLSFATLVGAAVSMIWGISLEGILGVLISIIILKAGSEMLFETLSSLIGRRPDRDLTKELKKKIGSYPGVRGAYDLTLHNYGPTQVIGSVHIEVLDETDAVEIHRLSRRIMSDIFDEYGITLTVGIYAANNSLKEFTDVRKSIVSLVRECGGVLQMHGFYGDEERKTVLFDLVMDFKVDTEGIRRQFIQRLEELYPQYHFDIGIDVSFSD